MLDNTYPIPEQPLVGSVELQIPASSEWVRVARLTIAGVASRLQFGFDDIEDIKLAVAEAVNNAIQHAPIPTRSSRQPRVTIQIDVHSDRLHIRVSDEGTTEGALPIHDSVPRRGDDNLPEGGLGLLLIRSLMDDVSHESGPESHTTVHMTKKLPVRRGEPAAHAGPARG